MKKLIVLLFALSLISCSSNTPSPAPGPNPVPPSPVTSPVNYKYPRGFIKPAGHGLHAGAAFTTATPAEVPLKFNWENAGFTVPVHNQGSCGSCWAFSSTENLEAASQLFLGQYVVLSEQEMVANNFDGCGGGDFAGDWMVSKGLILDSACPYEADGSNCSAPLSPPAAQALSYVNIGPSDGSPSVTQIQQAVMEFGPLSVDVAAGMAWDSYSGGVMGDCGNTGINHMVLLVGWDGSGDWIIRNSWGADWGQNGDVVMPYGCDEVASDVSTVLVQKMAQYQHHPIP